MAPTSYPKCNGHAVSYLERALYPDYNYDMIDRIVQRVKIYADEFDYIAMSGYSMATVAPIVAYKLKKRLCIVRKKKENAHSMYKAEFFYDEPDDEYNFAIIDDLVASGETVQRVLDALEPEGFHLARVFLYTLPHTRGYIKKALPDGSYVDCICVGDSTHNNPPI